MRNKYSLLILLLLLSVSPVYPEDDADLFARRILTLWQQNQTRYALIQAKEFIREHPEHELNEQFCLFIGEVFLKQKNYSEAVRYLNKIRSEKILDKAYPLLFKSLSKANQYNALYRNTKKLLKKSSLPTITLYHAYSLLHSREARSELGVEHTWKKAWKLYDSLKSTDLAYKASLGKAQILRLEGKYQNAIDLLIKLSKTYKEHTGEALYEAALIQINHTPSAALQTLESVMREEGPHGISAALNLASILLKKSPSEILEKKELFRKNLESTSPKKYHALLGLAYFNAKKPTDALSHLQKSLDPNFIDRPLLIAGMASAFQLDKTAIYETFFDLFESKFIDDSFYSRALLWKGLLLKKSHSDEAFATFQKLISTYSKTNDAQIGQIEIAKLAFKMGKAKFGHDTLFSLYKKNKGEALYAQIFQTFLRKTYRELENEALSFTEKEFYLKNIESSLETQNSLPLDVYLDGLLGYAKILNSLNREASFKLVMKQLIKKSIEEPKTLTKAHLYLSNVAKKKANDKGYVFHLERALTSSLNKKTTVAIHTKLFNYYLSQKDLSHEKAAEHLREAYTLAPESIQTSNLKWLGSYYYTKISEYMAVLDHPVLSSSLLWKNAESALSIFEHIANRNEENESIHLKTAELFLWMDAPKKALSILEKVPNEENDLNLSILYIKSYQKLGMLSKVNETLQKITSQTPPKMLTDTLYHLAFDTLNSNAPTSDENELALTWLENVIRYKDPSSEPLHLNAALEWAERKAKIPFYTIENHLKFLYIVKVNFDSEESLQDKDYHTLLMKDSEKKKLFDSYQMYIKTIIAKLESKQAKKKGRIKEAEFKEELGDILQQTLQKQSLIKNPFLKKKISSLQTMSNA